MTRFATPAILGGEPIRTSPFPARRTMGREERAAVLDVLDSDVLSAFIGGPGPFFDGGPRVREFESAWAERHGYAHAVSVNSWTSGLVAAIGAAGVGPGDEVICSPFTMSASATCSMFYGGIPVFADIDPDTLCLDPVSVESCITPRTRAIVVVHLMGRPADMDAFQSIARRHGVRIVEDAAQAPGVRYRGRGVGGIVDLGGFSLNFHKHLHTGEGGIVVTNDADLARRCRLIRNHGENVVGADDDLVNHIGHNFRLTELQAAIGIAQLAKLDGHLERRAALAGRLDRRIAELPGLDHQKIEAESTHAYYVYPFFYDAEVTGLSRSAFVRAVLAELPPAAEFETTPLVEGYVEPLYLSPVYQRRIAIGRDGFPFSCNPDVSYDYAKGRCPVAERMYERNLLLSPIVREPLDERDVDDFADACEKVLDHARAIRESLATDETAEIYTPARATNRSDAR